MEQRITNGTCEYGGPRIIPFFTGYANPCNHLFVNTGYTHHTMFVRISMNPQFCQINEFMIFCQFSRVQMVMKVYNRKTLSNLMIELPGNMGRQQKSSLIKLSILKLL